MSNQLRDTAGKFVVTQNLPATMLTAGTDDDVAVMRAPFNLKVTAVRFLPHAALTGETDTATVLEARNRGTDGQGTTSIASHTFDDDHDAVAFAPIDFTLSATAANLLVEEGEVISVRKTHTSTGHVIDGAIEIEYESAGVI